MTADEPDPEWHLTPEEVEKHADAIRGTFGYQRRKLAAAVGASKDATIHEIQRLFKRETN